MTVVIMKMLLWFALGTWQAELTPRHSQEHQKFPAMKWICLFLPIYYPFTYLQCVIVIVVNIPCLITRQASLGDTIKSLQNYNPTTLRFP
ncbi:hypothetical protein COCON_G00023740 [Conger conger]|uniref:Uncharacterized protein n=1 Tax=Conger conger TaxID=82655 RepID=A0A9Q1DXQ5_CONCO|nr:hypothetical protein COCON_G00023740 [Conger conger]